MELPKSIKVVEVGPRDGFQNVKTMIPTQDKVKIIKSLIDTGIREMEITSFVNPKWLPQMADAAQVAAEVKDYGPLNFRPIALAPNKRGVENAVRAGITNVTYVISCSESHNKKNVNRTIAQSLDDLEQIHEEFQEVTFRVSLAVSFGCPFEGKVTQEQVLANIRSIRDMGIKEIILCDTIGVANPLQVTQLLQEIQWKYRDIELGLHFHDTRGTGIANILAGMQMGVSTFETSVGGLGGCPFAPGSAGNTATEDFLGMAEGMKLGTGVNLEKYLEVVEMVKKTVDAPVTGRISSICKRPAI